MRIMNIIGTRPQYIKLGAMSLEFGGHDVMNIDTGQHYDTNMSKDFIDTFMLNIHKRTMDIPTIKRLATKFDPDIVLLYGDTYSTLLGFISSSHNFMIGHVEAGVRTFNRNYIEENIRMVTDHGSDLCFCPSDIAKQNLFDEGKVDGVYNTGDVMVDLIKKANITENKEKDYAFMTLHRPTNVDSVEVLEKIMKEILESNIDVIFPIHPRTRKMIDKHNIYIPINVKIVPPMNYYDTLSCIKNASVTITDSGGVEKETYILKTPGIIIRDDTPWPETHVSGWNRLTKIEEICDTIINERYFIGWKDYYGTGNARKKIMEIINENINS